MLIVSWKKASSFYLPLPPTPTHTWSCHHLLPHMDLAASVMRNGLSNRTQSRGAEGGNRARAQRTLCSLQTCVLPSQAGTQERKGVRRVPSSLSPSGAGRGWQRAWEILWVSCGPLPPEEQSRECSLLVSPGAHRGQSQDRRKSPLVWEDSLSSPDSGQPLKVIQQECCGFLGGGWLGCGWGWGRLKELRGLNVCEGGWSLGCLFSLVFTFLEAQMVKMGMYFCGKWDIGLV